MKRILVTGATGQIGSELTLELRKRYGSEHVVAGGHVRSPGRVLAESGPFQSIDCTRIDTIAEVVARYRIDTIYHLAAILSAAAEKNPHLGWNVNINGLYNILEVAREFRCAVFVPSSIAVFGPDTPPDHTPQVTIQRPDTIYGISKVTGELLCDYYVKRYGVDVRGVRYPGLVSYNTPPGGGTTDYAVDIYFSAVRSGQYTCYLKAGTMLDMMYMPDALRAAIELMETPPDRILHRNAYNVAAMTVSPEAIAEAIRKYLPDFSLTFEIDPLRQAIADSWPNSMDDSAARQEWGWSPRFDLKAMTHDMIENISRMTREND